MKDVRQLFDVSGYHSRKTFRLSSGIAGSDQPGGCGVDNEINQIYDHQNYYYPELSSMTDTASDSDLQGGGFRHYVGSDGVPVRRAVAPLTRSLQQICASFVAEALAKAELVQLEYALMVFVNIVPGISQQVLAEAMGVDRNNVGLIAERLEMRGLLRRSVSEDDRRARKVYLTPKGLRLWRQFQPEVVAANQRVLAPLNASERKLFIDMLVRLVEGNRAHARPGAGRRKRTPAKAM